MIRVLLIGDTHIPDRAEAIPRPLLEYIENLKPWDIVGFTGDLTSEEILESTRSLGRQVYVVRGNMDYLPLPKHSIFNIGDIVFGITHGDGVYPRGDIVKLSRQAQELGVQVFMTGHTHRDFVKIGTGGKTLLLNPGSLTGVWGGGGGSYTPSLIELEVEEYKILVKTIRLERGELKTTINHAELHEYTWILK
jgi:hypothetical protein